MAIINISKHIKYQTRTYINNKVHSLMTFERYCNELVNLIDDKDSDENFGFECSNVTITNVINSFYFVFVELLRQDTIMMEILMRHLEFLAKEMTLSYNNIIPTLMGVSCLMSSFYYDTDGFTNLMPNIFNRWNKGRNIFYFSKSPSKALDVTHNVWKYFEFDFPLKKYKGTHKLI